jgi:acetyl esterase
VSRFLRLIALLLFASVVGRNAVRVNAVRIDAAEPPKAGGGESEPRGKVYVYKQSGGKPRELEIYFPPNHDASKSKVPGVILFHGGAWRGGNLGQFRIACHYLASRGLVAATADYRMLNADDLQRLPDGESYKRVCITDAKSAIRWFKQHAGELGVDPQRIITGGGSAGGHVSVLATTNAGLNDPADPAEIDTSVVAYLLFNPAFAQADKSDVEVDALSHLRADFPPAIVFFGSLDGSWRTGWDAVEAKLEKLGNTTTRLEIAEGQAHGFFNRDPWRTVTLIAADRFLAEQGLLEGEPTLTAPSTGERLIPKCAATKSGRNRSR